MIIQTTTMTYNIISVYDNNGIAYKTRVNDIQRDLHIMTYINNDGALTHTVNGNKIEDLI